MNYESKLQQYISSLNWEERKNANQILNDYLKQGKTLRFTYYAFRQLKGRSVLKYRFLMFNREFQAEIWEKYLWSIAEDLDIVLFNGLATGDDLCTIQRWIDVEAYYKAERAALKSDWGDDEKYRYDVTKYLFDMINGLSPIDVNTMENIINSILDIEEKD